MQGHKLPVLLFIMFGFVLSVVFLLSPPWVVRLISFYEVLKCKIDCLYLINLDQCFYGSPSTNTCDYGSDP